MALLRALFRSARRTRTASRPPTGDEVLLDAPDDRLAPALVAAGRGEYEPAAKLLATTREAADWEDRDRYARRLAAFARSRPEWAEDWHTDAPNDPDALLLRAQLAVDRCWASPARAELLREVGPLVTAATDADPHDPVPWRIALDHARGIRADHTGFESLWTEAVRRSPHHYGCHVAALRYLAATWHGSHEECFDFAESAALDAPPDALVQALPVHAAHAYLVPRQATFAPSRRPAPPSSRLRPSRVDPHPELFEQGGPPLAAPDESPRTPSTRTSVRLPQALGSARAGGTPIPSHSSSGDSPWEHLPRPSGAVGEHRTPLLDGQTSPDAALDRGAGMPRTRLDAAADRAIALSARFPAADPWPAEVRNLLAFVLLRLERRQDALDQLRLIGPYVTSSPWDLVSDDPLGLFLRLREELASDAGRPTPDGLIPAPRRPRSKDGRHAAAGDH